MFCYQVRQYSRFRDAFSYQISQALAVCAVCSAVSLLAQEVAIVVPNQFTNAEAPGVVGEAPTSYFFQQVFDADQFAALPAGGARLQTIAWRMDGDFEGLNSYPAERFDITASVTSVSPDAMSEVFADNITGPRTALVEGPFNFTADGGDPGGPNPFTYRIDAVNPFVYDPAQGNLLLEVTAVNVPAALFIDFLAEPLPSTRQVSNVLEDPANPPLGGGLNPGGVVELTFVPEPTAMPLALLGCGALLARRRNGKAGCGESKLLAPGSRLTSMLVGTIPKLRAR